MIVGISGAREISDQDIKTIHDEMNKLVTDPLVSEIIFGGARGTDTWALLSAYDIKKTLSLNRPKLTVIVPNLVSNQPKAAQKAINVCADNVIRLQQEITRYNGWKALFDRNIAMINKSDMMVCFPVKSNPTGGTRRTMWESQKRKVKVMVVELEGKEAK